MLTISSCDASFCQREREPSAQNKNVCIIRALLCVEVREDGRTPQHKKNRVTEEKEKYLRAQIFIRLLRIISKNDHMEPVIHGHMCSHSTHTHTRKYTDLGQLPRRWYSQTVTNKECWLSSDFLKNMQKMSISLLAKQCHMGPHWP